MSNRSKLLNELKKQFLDDETLVSQYKQENGAYPSDLVAQKEKAEAIIKLWEIIAERLSWIELNDLVKYSVERRTYGQIDTKGKQVGQSEGASRQRGFKKMRRIFSKLSDLRNEDRVKELCAIISDNPSELEAGYPILQLGYPITFLQKHVVKVEKTRNTKVKVTHKCLIPEYLKESFNDNKTICTWCGIHCTRKADNKI